jgi:hypothetical protein
MDTHTPGPWKWLDYPDGRKLLVARDKAVIHCPDAPMTCDPSDQAVIAAAPELLAALKQWQELVNEWYAEDALEDLGGNIIKKLGHETDAAIKKAQPYV